MRGYGGIALIDEPSCEQRLRWAEEHCDALWRHRHDGRRAALALGGMIGFILGLILGVAQ